MTTKWPDITPATVQTKAKQAGETPDPWGWVERAVWSDRMLAALEHGVKGGKWFSLSDKVHLSRNLRCAWQRVRANRGGSGVDHQTVEGFERQLEDHLARLELDLQTGRYHPQDIRRVWIPKPGSSEKRPLGIPTVRDRVVQTAVRNVLEPIFEREFAEHSYGFRPGRSCHQALEQVTRRLNAGHTWVVDADLKGYFDSIPQKPLMDRIRERIADGRILHLLEAFLRQGIFDGLASWTPDTGTPQGAVISPLLANIYLNPLDHAMAAAGFAMIRYADDFVVLCRSEAEAQDALDRIRRWTESAGLTLHPQKTRIVDALQRGGFDFLGYHFERGHCWPREKSLVKIKATIRDLTRRANGQSLHEIVHRLNGTLRGWKAYFRYSVRNVFESLDKWIRMRLRSILRARHGGRGRGRGRDHNRWPNTFFAELGLLSLVGSPIRRAPTLLR